MFSWESRPSFHLKDTNQRISEVVSWYESHVGDLATELQSGNTELIHDALQSIPTCESSLLKTQLKAATSSPVCQPFLSDHQRGKRQPNLSVTVINLQTPSFPINDIRMPQTLGKSVGFSFPARPATMCVLAAAPTNLISRFKHRHLVSDKRASERPH